ncbi:MAG: U32 family peptidase, partial [Lachnospiraceae bacterium]|nr:U32 family peptidase [Lachnospiraceae bacterium]
GDSNALLVYGRIPMMVSAQCVRKTTGSGKCKVEDGRIQELTDRMNNVFPVKNYCKFCYNHIYNCKPVSLLTQQREIERVAPKVLRLDFTTETPAEAKLIAEKFVAAFLYGEDIMELKDFTRGHFKRGIR